MGDGTDAKATQVYVALEKLGKTVEELGVLVDHMERMLVSVLVPEEESKNKEVDIKSGPKVPLAGTLIDYDYKLRLLVDRLNSIQNRLEL